MVEKARIENGDTDQISLQEEYLKNLESVEEGQLIEGEVVAVNSDFVFVDVKLKSEGKIPLVEFETPPKRGDTVQVILLHKEGKEGQVIVSKLQADTRVLWKKIRDAKTEDLPVEGKFTKVIKGGFETDLGCGITAFTPYSKADIMKIEVPEKLLNIPFKFMITRLGSDKKIVLSRRDWLEQEIRKNKENFFQMVKVGDIVEGKVKSFASFGAFIDLGGFDGLLHLNDMSWGHATRPKDYLKKNQDIRLKVIKIDPAENKINLSLKHFTPDPWTTFAEKYRAGDVVKGKVTKLADFGAFIEIEEGIEGLAHISELSWVKKVNHPKEVLNVDDIVDTKILSFDIDKQRVSLGLKQVLDNPWDDIEKEYPIGKEVKRKVVKLTNTGAFVELEEGIDGFIHVDDVSWTKKYKNPSAVLQEGEEYAFVVIDTDAENRRIRLGMKQLSEDPWKTLARIFQKGSIVEGEVSSTTDFGVFVKVQGEIEGLIHKNDLAEKNEDDDTDPISKFPVGTPIKAVVTELNPQKKKLGLSVKEYVRRLQNEEISKYIHDDEGGGTVTFGDLLKHKENQDNNT